MQPGKDAPSTPSTNLTLVAPQQFEFVGPVLLEVNGRSMPLTSHTVSLPRAAGPLSIAGVSGDAALALFDMLSMPVEVIVSGRRITPGGSQEAYRAVTHTRWLHEAAAQFGVCAARSAPSSER